MLRNKPGSVCDPSVAEFLRFLQKQRNLHLISLNLSEEDSECFKEKRPFNLRKLKDLLFLNVVPLVILTGVLKGEDLRAHNITGYGEIRWKSDSLGSDPSVPEIEL